MSVMKKIFMMMMMMMIDMNTREMTRIQPAAAGARVCPRNIEICIGRYYY